MLVFCNNLLSDQGILYDRISNIKYLLIHKNGSASLEDLAKKYPERYKIYQADALLDKTKVEEIVVFIRDPLKRFFSGLSTQLEIYKIPHKVITDIINYEETVSFFDLHTTPQFWAVLRLGKQHQVKFKFLPMSELGSVDTNIKHLNKSCGTELVLSNKVLQRLNHFYTEDIVMYNNFLNKTVLLDEIIEKIKLEKEFVDDLTQYKQLLTYLL